MQSLERRLVYLEAAKARQLERLTDAELDQRIAALLAQMPSKVEAAASEVNHHAEH